MKKITIIALSIITILGLTGCTDSNEIDLEIIEDVEDVLVEEEVIELEDDLTEELILLADLTWGASAALSSQTLTIEDMLLYAIQDEYSAQAEYTYIIANFDVTKPFTNIVNAEATHIEMLTPLFTTYDLILPSDTADDHLIEVESVYEAFETGVYAEIINIAMYNEFLTYDLPDDIEAVFISLRDASMKHLEAFEKNLAK